MKIYKTQQEVERDIVDGLLKIDEDVRFECDISISASIIVTRGNISAWDISAWNINAGDINAKNINAMDINADDIFADDIGATSIDAENISYHAFCITHKSIKCNSIEARQHNHRKPICLDGELIIKPENTAKQELLAKADELIAKANELKHQAEGM